jgi:hypothetical protein
MGTFPEVLEAILAILTLLGGLYGLFSLWCVVGFFRPPRYSPEEPFYNEGQPHPCGFEEGRVPAALA